MTWNLLVTAVRRGKKSWASIFLCQRVMGSEALIDPKGISVRTAQSKDLWCNWKGKNLGYIFFLTLEASKKKQTTARRIKKHHFYPDLRLQVNTATAIQVPTPRWGFGDLAQVYSRRVRRRHLEEALKHLGFSAPIVATSLTSSNAPDPNMSKNQNPPASA